MVGGVWNGHLLGRVRGQPVPCQFCGGLCGDGHLFEFHDLMRMDKGYWPRCLLWHGWLPLLSGGNGASPWAESAAQGAGKCSWSYSSWLLFEWIMPDEFDADDVAQCLPGAVLLGTVAGWCGD